VFPGHARVFLAWTRIVGDHSPGSRLSNREDGDGAERMVSWCRYSGGLCNRCAFCAVHFLAPAHAGFVAFPGVALLPGDRVASCAVLRAGAVREDGQSRRPESCASRMAAASSSMVVVASRGVTTSSRTVSSLRSSIQGMTGVVDRACCPMSSLAWSPHGRLAS